MGNRTKCCLCNTSKKDILSLGEIKACGNIHAHYYCLLLASTIKQSGNDDDGILGFLPSDILEELKRSQERICAYCKRKGASVVCNNKHCRVVFHLPCGIAHDSGHQFFGRYISHCVTHRPKQRYVRPQEPQACPICYDEINFSNWASVLWAPCCKKNSYFHKKCIQQMALSAGYFFKCPICNNNEVFQKTMKQYGVFIPDRDASWELEPNAYADLLYRHDECNAKICICSRGRQYSNVGSWAIVLCDTCGSQGTHVCCSKLKKDQIWLCSDCTIQRDITAADSALSRCEIRTNSHNSDVLPSTSQASTSFTDDVDIVGKSSSRRRGVKRKRNGSSNSLPENNKPEVVLPKSEPFALIEIDSDDSDVVILDDDESSYKCLVAKDGSLLKVHNINQQYEQFCVQGDLEIEEDVKPAEDALMKIVIKDVKSLFKASDDDDPKGTRSAAAANIFSDSVSSDIVLYNPNEGNQRAMMYNGKDQSEHLYIVQEVTYNRINMCQNGNSKLVEQNNRDVGNYSSSSDSEIVVID